MFLHRSLKNEKLNTTIETTIQLLSQLAFNGLVNQDHRKLPRLVFDETDFEKILLRTLASKFRTLKHILLLHENKSQIILKILLL